MITGTMWFGMWVMFGIGIIAGIFLKTFLDNPP